MSVNWKKQSEEVVPAGGSVPQGYSQSIMVMEVRFGSMPDGAPPPAGYLPFGVHFAFNEDIVQLAKDDDGLRDILLAIPDRLRDELRRGLGIQ